MRTDNRLLVERRHDYVEFGREDQFVVPLLASLIDGALRRWASHPAAGARALDVGCGGQPTRKVLEGLGYTYVGMDVVQNADQSVEVLAPIDGSLPPSLVDCRLFDLIVCTEVLEHVAHWDIAFGNFSALLAPGGRVVITCPFVWKSHEVPYDFWRPTPFAVEAHAERAGLSVLESRAAGSMREALGSVMAQVSVESDGSGPSARFRRRAISATLRALLTVLKGPWFRKDVRISGGYHLTTFVVLEKASGAQPPLS